MPAFKRFGPGDQVDNVLILEPQYDLVSGSAGWRGSPNGSASLSLYGGMRRSPADVLTDIRYQSTYPNVNQTGQPTRGLPLTASINVVWMTNETLNFTQVNSQRWGEEHWDTVQRLYQDYYAVDPDYVTASYDNYAVYFQKDSTNVIALTGGFDGNFYPSSSAQMNVAVGWGNFGFGWLMDETTGSLTASFTPTGAPLPLQFDTGLGGGAAYGNPGPLIPGTDLCVGFPLNARTSRFDGGQNFNVAPGSDLLLAYVGRFKAKPTNYGNILGRIDSAAINGWALAGTDGTVYSFFGAQNVTEYGGSIGNEYLVGEWHVGIAAIDRSNGNVKFGVRGLNTGRTFVSPDSFAPNLPFTGSSNFYYGNTAWVAANETFELAALYMNTGSSVATGVLPNLTQALANFSNYLGGYSPASLTSSFTLESWIKPFHGSRDRRAFTIQSRNNVLWFGMTGSAGQLAFSASNGTYVTASIAPLIACWNHVAVTYDATTYSGTLYLNMTNVGAFTMTPLTASNRTTLHSIGNVIAGGGTLSEGVGATGTLGMSFHGLIGESRVWDKARTYTQLSATFNSRITGSGLAVPQMSLPFNDGPLSRVYTFPMGSGALDHARYYQGQPYQFARFWGFDDRIGPMWQPNDNTRFYVPKQMAPSFVPGNSTIESASLSRGDDLARMVAIDIPQAFYGRQIVPGTVLITDRAYSSASYGLVRNIVDDGRGNLYVSGSLTSGSQTPMRVGFPRTQTDANSAIGYGNWSFGYLLDDLGQSTPVAPTWGAASLSTSGPGPLVNQQGPFGEGNRSMRIGDIVDDGPLSTRFLTSPTAATFDIGSGDFAVAWVARLGNLNGAYNGSTIVDFTRMFCKSTFAAGSGTYQIGYYGQHYGVDGIRWEGNDNPGQSWSADTGAGGAVPNEWHVGIALLDRSRNKARVGTKSLLTGREFISNEVDISALGAVNTSADFFVGSFANGNFDCAGFMIASGSGSATGMSANISTALENFASYVMTPRTFDSGSVGWNKVGNVFYGEGLITIKDPSLLDIGRTDGWSANPTDTLQLSFRGQSRIPVKTLMCRIDRGEFNATSNPTFLKVDDDGSWERRHASGSVRVTTVGLYNKDRELVGVARLADPVRIRPRDRINIKLRMDF